MLSLGFNLILGTILEIFLLIKLFQDAKELGNKYFLVFVGDSIPDDIFDNYETEAPKLMELFDGKKPKLCGTRTLMRAPVILSRVEVMTTLFSFLFNDGSKA